MKIFLDNEDELKEIKPIEESEDKGIVITPTIGKRNEEINEIQKELAALDALVLGASKSAEIHDLPQSSISKYKDGKDLTKNDEVRTRILARKYDIQDTAVTKLMETLDLIKPAEVVRTREKIQLMNGLSQLVERISDKTDDNKGQQVHLHLYAPNQRKLSDYEIIDA